ncbi:hypothetical protein MMC12_002287 [Toensbergia leucococca]|nr:hypothetical protein [Toensbergia leucococca]
MSTTTPHSPMPKPAPWSSLFQTHISRLPSPEFVLSTLSPAQKDSPTPFFPRARYCIYRGMWATLPENKHNPAPPNPRVYESDLPTFTSDVRMQKIPEIFATGAGHGGVEQAQGSGGGGAVEAVYWVKEVGVQWRVKGRAFVVARDVEGEGEGSSGVRTLKSEVGARMRVLEEGMESEWSWARELTAHFGNCSPGMRGSWRNPPPGAPVKGEPDKDHQLGQKVTDLEDPVARENFRVVIILPDEVEQCDISDPEKARRWRYKYVEGDWTTEELWP